MAANLALVRFSNYHGDLPDNLYRRFSSKERAESFLNGGNLFLRNLSYYRGLEKTDEIRGDSAEGSYQNKKFIGGKFSIKVDGEYKEIGDISSFVHNSPNPNCIFISCFSKEKHEHQRKFGNYLVRINNPFEFVERMTSGIVTRDHLCWGAVKYYDWENDDELIDGLMNQSVPPWMIKHKKFTFEHEFRFSLLTSGVRYNEKSSGFTEPTEKEILKFEMGSIEDIASIEFD